MRRYIKQIQLGVFALAAAALAATGVVLLSGPRLAPPSAEETQAAPQAAPKTAPEADKPAESPPLAVKPVATQSVSPEPYVPPDLELESAWADKLREAPDYQAFFSAMRAGFPAEWIKALRETAAQGGLQKADGVDLLMSESVRLARQNSGLLAAKAGGAALDTLFARLLQVARQLAAGDAALCLDYLNGAPADRFVAFAALHRGLMGAQALAGLEAMEDGGREKIQRDAPGPSDFDDLEKALKARGLPAQAIALLLDGKPPETPIPDDQACANGLAYLETLAALPEPQRMRLYALAVQLMAHE